MMLLVVVGREGWGEGERSGDDVVSGSGGGGESGDDVVSGGGREKAWKKKSKMKILKIERCIK